MSKWSHQPLGLAWEWRLNLVLGIGQGCFLEVPSPSWCFSSENIPLCCIIVQTGTLTTELNLSGLPFRTQVLRDRKHYLCDLNINGKLRVQESKWAGFQIKLDPELKCPQYLCLFSLFYGVKHCLHLLCRILSKSALFPYAINNLSQLCMFHFTDVMFDTNCGVVICVYIVCPTCNGTPILLFPIENLVPIN